MAVARTQILQHVFELIHRTGPGFVGQDADVAQGGGGLGLTIVSRACEQGRGAISRQVKALKKTEAKSVVAGEIIHAFLLKNQHAIEALVGHCGTHPFDAGVIFIRFEMKGHFWGSRL